MNQQMLPVLLTFNYAPVEYIDPSWFETFERGDMIAAIIESSTGKQWASQAILQATSLQESADFDFENPLKSIALQSKNALIQIIFHAGIVANYPFLKSVIRGKERKALETCLGEKAYHFALKKAPLIAGKLPSVFDCTFTVDWNAPDEIKKHVFRSGIRLLGAVFAKEPEAYKKRLLFNFPAVSQDYFYAAAANQQAADVHKSGSALLKKLMKEFCR
ncbi:MAG: SctK family type III secretion system sorting platform protein [Endozoicomonadaceae bacterium]|nr:SctK family type III secretion system sorting platform protein [Endozoicomonadaceae bacterium]